MARHRASRSVRPWSAWPVIAPVPLSSTMTAWIESASPACASAYLRDPMSPCSSPVNSTNRIAQSGLRPKRTIRFVLFTGEEQGLIGSRKYAEAHAGDADSIQAVIVLDNGTGAITGQALQGRTDLEALWRAILAPVATLGADSVVNRNKGGTDHLSFLPYGVPGFNFNQLERGYNHTHHSQSDTYDMAIAADLVQASAVMAVSAFELANLPGMIPRGEHSTPTPVQAVKVSDSLLVKGRGSN